jgi:hypothetical protein
MEWTPTKDAKLLSLRDSGLTFTECAEAMTNWYGETCTKDACSNRMKVIVRPPGLSDQPPSIHMPFFHKYFDEEGQPLNEPKKYDLQLYIDSGMVAPNNKQEILHISDLHIPFQNEELLDTILRRHAAADLVVVTGDALDCYAYSRFPKDRNVPIEQEIESWIRLQAFLAARFPNVVIVDSNHADRVKLALATVPLGLSFLVEPNIHRYLARPFNNVHVVGNWYFQVGDAIFAHADYARGRAPQSVVKVAEFLENNRQVGQLDIQPFRLLVQAHTHKVGTLIFKGRKLVESGCLARLPLDYTVSAGSVSFPEPQVNGYVSVVQENGRTDLNASREHYLGDFETAA